MFPIWTGSFVVCNSDVSFTAFTFSFSCILFSSNRPSLPCHEKWFERPILRVIVGIRLPTLRFSPQQPWAELNYSTKEKQRDGGCMIDDVRLLRRGKVTRLDRSLQLSTALQEGRKQRNKRVAQC